jgi:hypothetical protein
MQSPKREYRPSFRLFHIDRTNKSPEIPNMGDVIEFCHKASERLMSEGPQSTFPEVLNNGMIGIILGKLRIKTTCVRRRQEGDEDRRV